MSNTAHPVGSDFQQAFARDLLALLQKNVEMAQHLASTALPEPVRAAALDRNDAGTRRGIVQAVPEPAKAAPAQASAESPYHDPEFEAPLLKMADDHGWWHTDPADIVEDFDWMLVGLVAMQEEYVRYCARKGLDPATALPSLSKLAAGLDATAQAIVAAPVVSAPDAPPAAPPAPRERAAAPAASFPASPPISDFGKRYLDLRCEGYALQRKSETPDVGAGASFRANSRRNNEATIALFVDLCGDLPTADIQEHHCKDFVSFPHAHSGEPRQVREGASGHP